MDLNTFKKYVDYLIEKGFGESSVLITLADNSIGGRASVGVKYISNGFDWEQGQIRIEPEKKIISYEKNRDNVMEPTTSTYSQNGKLFVHLNCKRCGNKLRKKDIFCSRCGQKCKGERKEIPTT